MKCQILFSICMQCQILFSGKNRKSINLSSAVFAQRVVKINFPVGSSKSQSNKTMRRLVSSDIAISPNIPSWEFISRLPENVSMVCF